jgi:D-alanine-D-alanine ligase
MRTGKRIGILMGGLSSERELSLRTGEAVYAALAARGHDVVRVFVDRDLDLALRAERVDTAFVALHGRYGEDGCVQGLLELLGIPYTGSSLLASALAMDKLKAKELFRQHNLPTPPYYVYRRGDGAPGERHGAFGFPAVVKPRAQGSSLGVRRVESLDELEAALDEALRFDEHALVERYIDGRELHVVLLGGRLLGVIEVAAGPIFDTPARLNGACAVLPPRLAPERLRGVVAIAERAARALECSGLVEIDLLLSERGNEQLLEVDTHPSLLPHAPALRVAQAAGLDLGALAEAMLAEAALHASARAADRLERAVDGGWPAPERRAASSEPH